MPLISMISSSHICEDGGNIAIHFAGTAHALSKAIEDQSREVVPHHDEPVHNIVEFAWQVICYMGLWQYDSHILEEVCGFLI